VPGNKKLDDFAVAVPFGPFPGVLVGRSIDVLSDSERVAFYRQLALEALQLAQIAITDDQATAYLDIATRWTSIADEVERWTMRQSELEARNRAATRNDFDRQQQKAPPAHPRPLKGR
jgi:hypothetical protein